MASTKVLLAGCVFAAGWSGVSMAATDLKSAIKEGQVNGYFRTYYNIRDFPNRPNPSALATGGGLRAETAALSGFKLGAGFYTAQDLGTNDANPAKVDGRLGSEVEVLGEAYINFAGAGTSVTLGRQKIVTPFANPIDVFMIPFTYEGLGIKNQAVENLTLEMNYVNSIKAGNSKEFVDVGTWSTRRLGVGIQETSGTLMLGASYKKQTLDLQGWYYNFADLFDSYYLQAGRSFNEGGSVQPFVAAQFGLQQESGDKLLGKVDSTLFGLQGGATIRQAKLTAGYNKISAQTDAFNNGGFLTPYNFSTSPLFTNSMVENMENVDSGDAVKLTALYSFSQLDAKLSYAAYDFTELADRDALDLDFTYNMTGNLKGLSLRVRFEVVTSDTSAVEQVDNRFQLQYVF
ncbi:MAG: OprD family outer membrane porin [Cellvibrio sp.]